MIADSSELPMDPVRLGEDGLYSLILKPTPHKTLEHLLDPEIPYVWVVGYMPRCYVRWWGGLVQLGPDQAPRSLEVRSLSFEFQVQTAEFLRLSSGIPADHPLVLYQMRQRVPDTLLLERLNDRSRVHVLVQNGLHASYFDFQCGAEFAAPDRRTLDRALRSEQVRALVAPYSGI